MDKKKRRTDRGEASASSLALERRLIHAEREERGLTGGSRRGSGIVVLPDVAGAVKVVSIVQTLMV